MRLLCVELFRATAPVLQLRFRIVFMAYSGVGQVYVLVLRNEQETSLSDVDTKLI